METVEESWRVDHRDEMAVNLALYMRDALALSDDVVPVVPNLAPSVAVTVPAGVDRDAVARDWPGWWADVLQWCRDQGPLDDIAPALDGRPALRVALDVFREPAERHRSAVNRARARPTLLLNTVVSGLEQELGRKARPFHLVIVEVALGEPLWAPLTPTVVLASIGFTDTEPARAALRETLLPIA